MESLSFETKIQRLSDWPIIRLPKSVSEQLPSRGMVMGSMDINGISEIVAIEPDGHFMHWIKLSEADLMDFSIHVGDVVKITLTPTNKWTEPELPQDIFEGLESEKVFDLWQKITTKARWEWIRWIRFTKNPATRAKRIATMCSMLNTGKKRPCCFDQSRCTYADVAKNGILDDGLINEH